LGSLLIKGKKDHYSMRPTCRRKKKEGGGGTGGEVFPYGQGRDSSREKKKGKGERGKRGKKKKARKTKERVGTTLMISGGQFFIPFFERKKRGREKWIGGEWKHKFKGIERT